MSKLIPLDHRLARRRQITATGCWLWTGSIQNAGYGAITMQRSGGAKRELVHRVAYQHFVGAIPAGLQLDHLCRVRACFNPVHLEPVTPRENVMRSPITPAAINAAKTHCPQGHPYSDDNIYRQRDGGRLCRTCQLARTRSAVSA